MYSKKSVLVKAGWGLNRLYIFLLVIGCIGWLCTGVGFADVAQPRVAIWDPQAGSTNNRFRLDPGELDQIAQWMSAGQVSVARLTAQQIADPDTFSAQKFDAVLFVGSAFPRTDLGAMKQFCEDGGVLIDLNASVPRPMPRVSGICHRPSHASPGKQPS